MEAIYHKETVMNTGDLRAAAYQTALDHIEERNEDVKQLLEACRAMLASDGLIGSQPNVLAAVEQMRAAVAYVEGHPAAIARNEGPPASPKPASSSPSPKPPH